MDNGNGRPQLAPIATTGTVKTGEYATEWVIDYRYAEITLEEGKTVVTFRNTGEDNSALNLGSGVTYYFEIQANTICDTSDARNTMGTTRLDEFTTVFAQVNLSVVNTSTIDVYGIADPVDVNAVWRLETAATDRVDASVDWDMLIWTDTNLSFNLYRRIDGGNWEKLDTEKTIMISSATEGFLGLSLTQDFLKPNQPMVDFDPLNELKDCEFAIEFTVVEGQDDPLAWNGRVNIRVDIVAGTSNNLRLISTSVNESNWDDVVGEGRVSEISLPEDFTIIVPFSDQSVPYFTSGYPQFEPGATDVEMSLLLNRPGTIYY